MPPKGCRRVCGSPETTEHLTCSDRRAMPLRAENDFTDEEWIAAFSLILPPGRARQQALSWISRPGQPEDDTAEDLAESEPLGPASYDDDILDLLSLVSERCAERAGRRRGAAR